jgi:protein TonB
MTMPTRSRRRFAFPLPALTPAFAPGLAVAVALAMALVAAPMATADGGDGAAQISSRFTLIAASAGPGVGTEGVLVVPGTVLPLEGPNRGGSGEERAAEVSQLATRLLRTLRLRDMKVLYTFPVTTPVGRTLPLPPPTATSPLKVSVELQGYNPEIATYRVRFQEGTKTFTDSVVSVGRGKRAVVGGLDGEEAPYLFLVVAPSSVAEEGAEPKHVGGDITPPRRIEGVPPSYTEEARKERIQGVVIVRVVIDKSGDITDVEVLKGLPMGLSGAAVDAIRTWRFEPARNAAGEPVEVYYNLTINFRLDDGDLEDVAATATDGG